MSLALSLKHPSEVIWERMSGSIASSDGMMCVGTAAIIGTVSVSSSPFVLPPATTHGCFMISFSWDKKGRQQKVSSFVYILNNSELYRARLLKSIFSSKDWFFFSFLKATRNHKGRISIGQVVAITSFVWSSRQDPLWGKSEDPRERILDQFPIPRPVIPSKCKLFRYNEKFFFQTFRCFLV